MRKGYIFVVLLLCLTMITSGCGRTAQKTTVEVPALSEASQPGVSETAGQPQPQIVEQYLCPLTGLPIEKEQMGLRPIAVMIDNFASARPQSGLIDADIVYEMPAEGGITRYMAIFHHEATDKIGPVRSARSYFIDKAMEYNAVYVHCGGSEEAKNDINALKIDSLNELNGESNFWRARDRQSPHNLYTSTKLTREVMKIKKLDNEKWSSSFKFSNEFLYLDGKSLKSITINYLNNYKVSYQYDDKDKIFYRMISGVRVKDKDTSKEISTVNIIIEKVNTKVIDKIGHLDLENTGKGRGYLLSGGKLIEIEWKKDNRQDKTNYTDLKGNSIQLNKGNTWIQVVPDYATIEFKE